MWTRQHEVGARTMLLVALTVGCCWILLQLWGVLLVLVLALFLVGTLNPAVAWLERRCMRRGFAIGTVFAILFSGITLSLVLTLPTLVEQLRTLVEQEPQIRNRLADWLMRSSLTQDLANSLRHLRYGDLAKSSLGSALVWSSHALESVAYAVSSVFLALYMMLDRDRLRGVVFALVPRRRHVAFARVLLKLETIVGGYIRGQALTSAFMAGFVATLLSVVGISNALALAVLAGIADVLPYIGVFLTVAPAAAATSAKGLVATVLVVTTLLAYEEFESRFLVPRIYGRVLRLPSTMVLIALLVGAALLGIVGALLALPVAAAIRMLVEEWRVVLPGEPDDPEQQRRDQRAEALYAERTRGMPAGEAARVAFEMSQPDRAVERGGSVL
ncbi:MAG: AI-2E family transporter [Myxococcales bacterium]